MPTYVVSYKYTRLNITTEGRCFVYRVKNEIDSQSDYEAVESLVTKMANEDMLRVVRPGNEGVLITNIIRLPI